MPTAVEQPALEDAVALVDGAVVRLGGGIDLDGRVSWYPADLRGVAPHNSYLLTSGAASLLTDPGLSVIEAPLLRQLAALVGPNTDLSVVIMRHGEFDGVANVAPVLSRLRVSRVYAALPAHYFIGFSPRYAPQPEAVGSSWTLDSGIEWPTIRAGDVVEVDAAQPGTRTLEILRPPLRMTPSSWAFDRETGTLFTTDSFGHVVRRDRSESPVLTEADDDRTTVDDVRRFLLAKFDFLPIVDTGRLAELLQEVFAARDVQIVAPAYGCVLKGRRVVERHLELMLAALGEWQR